MNARPYINPIKSKLIAFNCATTENIYVTFDGEKIQRISKDVHLGNIVGECSNEIRIKVTTDDFIRRANTVMSQFKLAPYSIKYQLFKSFCSSLYGFLLWDMSAKSINKFYISWRKCLRQLYQLPYRTHSNLLHLISKDQSVDVQLHLRIMKYVMSNLKSTNSLVRLSTQLCMSGSKSLKCKSINHIMSIYGLSKFQVNNYDSRITIKNKIINVSESNVKDESRKAAGNIIDLMTMRENCDNYEFSHDELDDMLKNVCTE